MFGKRVKLFKLFGFEVPRRPGFAEVYVDCPEEICRKRDSKGLWKQADTAEITALPGPGVPYEPPDSPEAKVDTAQLSIEEAAHHALNQLEKQGLFRFRVR
jgi:adenylylsulfate kinase-like enzyme